MSEINIKDRKILFELSRNCRLPTTQLAKRVGLSQQGITYRINRLIKTGIISDFITEIDLRKIGYER